MSRQDKGGAGMILNRGPPSGFETSNKISNSGGTDMYIEHPYFYEGKESNLPWSASTGKIPKN